MDLLKAKGIIIEDEEFVEKVSYLQNCIAMNLHDEVNRMVALCSKEVREMSDDCMESSVQQAICNFATLAFSVHAHRAIAEEMFSTVLTKDPKNMTALAHLVDIQHASQDDEKTIITCKQLLSIDPSHVHTLCVLMECYLRRKEVSEDASSELLSYYHKAFDRVSDRVCLEKLIEFVCESHIPNSKSFVVARLEESLQKAPEDALVLYYLGRIYRRGGGGVACDCARAKNYFEQAIAVDPVNISALRGLADIYMRGGNGVMADVTKALEYLKRAMSV